MQSSGECFARDEIGGRSVGVVVVDLKCDKMKDVN